MYEKAKTVVAQFKARAWNPKQSPFLFLELADAIFSIPLLDAQLKGNAENLDDFFKQRWDFIANGPLCYTHNPEYSLNVACDALADFKKSRLMPTVSPQDVLFNELDEASWGSFFVSDDRKYFIRLDELIATAYTNIRNSEVVIYVDNQKLSEAELKRTGKVYEILEKMRHLNASSEESGGLYTEIVLLRNGLENGDMNHSGKSEDAGGPAALAVLRFFMYFDALPDTKKNEIRGLKGKKETFGETLDKLRRNFETAKSESGGNLSVKYCVMELGGSVSSVIDRNNDFLRTYKSNPAARLAALHDSVEHLIRVGKPLSSPHIFTTPLDTQIQAFYDVINRNLSVRKDECTELLFNLIQFIVSECQRKIASQSYDGQLNCYLDLLWAVGLETSDFCRRPRLDNLFVIKETIFRLSILTNCRSGFRDRFGQPTSLQTWSNWLRHNKVLPLFFGISPIPKKTTDLVVYTAQYPSPREITSQKLTFLRDGYTLEPVVVAEASVRKQPAWEFTDQNVVKEVCSTVADELKNLARDQTLNETKEIILKSNITTIDEALAFDQLFRALENNKTVTKLCLHGLKLYPAMVYRLQELLEKNTTLKELDLQGCFLASEVSSRPRKFFDEDNNPAYTVNALLLPSLRRNHSLRRYIPPVVLAEQLVKTTEEEDRFVVNAVNESLVAEQQSTQEVCVRNLSEIYAHKLKQAMAANDFKRVMYLLSKKLTNLEIGDQELLCIAVRDKDCDRPQNIAFIRQHFRQDATDHDGSPLLHFAHTVTVARCLYECGANIYAQDASNKRALFEAKRLNKKDIVQFLDACVEEQNTRFLNAVHADNIEEVKRLVELGQNSDFKIAGGRTPLHFAQSPEIIEFLLEKGLSINAQDDEKKTPLHCAHNIEVVRCLIEKGADILARDAEGNIPKDYPGNEKPLFNARLQIIEGIYACFSQASSPVDNVARRLAMLARFEENEIINILKQKNAQGYSVLSLIQYKLRKKLELPAYQKIITSEIEEEFESCYFKQDLKLIIELIQLGVDLSDNLEQIKGVLLIIINNHTPADHEFMYLLIMLYLSDLEASDIEKFLRLKNKDGFSLLYFMERPPRNYSSNINLAKYRVREDEKLTRVNMHDFADVERCVKGGASPKHFSTYPSDFEAYARDRSHYNFNSLRYFLEHNILIDKPSLKLFVAAAEKGKGEGAKEFLEFLDAKRSAKLMAKRANQSSGSVLRVDRQESQSNNNSNANTQGLRRDFN